MDIKPTPPRWPSNITRQDIGIYATDVKRFTTLLNRSACDGLLRLQHFGYDLSLPKTEISRAVAGTSTVVFQIKDVLERNRLTSVWVDASGQEIRWGTPGGKYKSVTRQILRPQLVVWGAGVSTPAPEHVRDYLRWRAGEIPWSHTFAHLMSQNEWESAAH